VEIITDNPGQTSWTGSYLESERSRLRTYAKTSACALSTDGAPAAGDGGIARESCTVVMTCDRPERGEDWGSFPRSSSSSDAGSG